MSLDTLVEEILNIAREQPCNDATIIIRDRIEKDVIKRHRQLITRLTEALADAVRCVGHLHTNDCPMQNYETPCKCWVTPARDALDAAAIAKERAL